MQFFIFGAMKFGTYCRVHLKVRHAYSIVRVYERKSISSYQISKHFKSQVFSFQMIINNYHYDI